MSIVSPTSRTDPLVRWAVSAIGLSILLGIVGRWVAFHPDIVDNFFASHHLVELAFTGSFGVVVLVVGVLLALGYFQLPPAAYGRIARRSLTGFLGFGVIVMALLLVSETISLDDLTYYVLFAASIGGAVGLLFGMQEAYSVRNAREAERKGEAVRRAERERARLEYLNHVLRHEVLNNVSIIDGYAELALDGPADERPDEHLTTIRAQSTEMTAVIRDVRTLIDALQRPDDELLDPVDLGEILAGEIRGLENSHDVVVTSDVPDDLAVLADHLLTRVFGNLLSNAVLHNDAAIPHVDVSVDQTPDVVRVHIADDGPGIPESVRETLFERSGRGDHGLGLYLVRTITARYGGSVELSDTGGDGSVFTVTLPRWTEDREVDRRVDRLGSTTDTSVEGFHLPSFDHAD